MRILDLEKGEDRSYLFEVMADAPVGTTEKLENGHYLIKGETRVYKYNPEIDHCDCPAIVDCWHAKYLRELIATELAALYG